MVSLSPCQRSQLYECASNTLRALLDDDSSASSGKAAEISLNLIVDIVAAVQSAVSAAFADFNEKWNDANPDSLMRLPVEVLNDCFRSLRKRERFTVSHVCRGWRRVALADKLLWTDFNGSDNVEQLATLLSRSYPAPFRLSWMPVNVSANGFSAGMELVARNMGRIEHLNITGMRVSALGSIVDRPAPLLRHLRLEHADDVIELPRQWGTRQAPRFESLTVHVFSVPREFAPLTTLRKFRGYLPIDGASGMDELGLHNMFRMMPGLTLLCLLNVTAESLSVLPPLPRSIVEVEFGSMMGRAVDVSAYIETYPEHPARRFEAGCIDNVPATIDAFARKVRGTWGMTSPGRRGWIKLEELDQDRNNAAVYSVVPLVFAWWDARLPFMRCLDRLSSLTLPMRPMLDFASANETVWDRRLPFLRALTVALLSHDDVVAACYHVARRGSAAPLQCPQLERVTLSFSPQCNVDEFVGATLPALMPLLVAHDHSQPLDALFVCRSVAQLRDRGVKALSHLARRVQIREEPSNVLLAEFMDGELVRGPQTETGEKERAD